MTDDAPAPKSAARAITRHRFRGKAAASSLIMAPLILPEIIIAIALLVVLLSIGMQLSLFTVILGHLLNSNGFIESEITVTRLGAEHFYVLSAAVARIVGAVGSLTSTVRRGLPRPDRIRQSPRGRRR